MPASDPLFKIRRDHFLVLQGTAYVTVDRSRVDAVHYRSGTVTVRYKERGEVTLNCTRVGTTDLKDLVSALQRQRDQNQERDRHARLQKNSASMLPSLFG